MAVRAHAARRPAGARTRRPARRPAARRRPGARRQSRIHWDRLGRIALTVVLAAVVFSYFNPAIDFVQTYRATSAAKQDLRELQAENRRLHDRVQSADDPAVLEREARRQGMVVPGERPYVISGLRG